MSENNEEEGNAGMGAKIVFASICTVALTFYYFVALNWVLMGPAQNLAYPYK